jgi:hypothetical protein
MAAKEHTHDAVVHSHEHYHIVHFLLNDRAWVHQDATHEHEHNHAPLTHTHSPHVGERDEHVQEAHIHDHERPTQSPG